MWVKVYLDPGDLGQPDRNSNPPIIVLGGVLRPAISGTQVERNALSVEATINFG
jgi:hypothetical protein